MDKPQIFLLFSPRIFASMPSWCPWLVGLVGFGLTLLLWHALLTQERDIIDREVQRVEAVVRTILEREVLSNIHALERLTERWQRTSINSEILQKRDSTSLLEDFKAVQVLALLSEDFKIRWMIQPTEGRPWDESRII